MVNNIAYRNLSYWVDNVFKFNQLTSKDLEKYFQIAEVDAVKVIEKDFDSIDLVNILTKIYQATYPVILSPITVQTEWQALYLKHFFSIQRYV